MTERKPASVLRASLGPAVIAAVVAILVALVAIPTMRTNARQENGGGEGSGRDANDTAIPAGFRADRGPGFSITVPAAWRRHEEGRSIKWIAGSGAYIQVDRTPWSGDPYKHWEWFEKQVTSEDGGLVDYRRVALTSIFVNGNDAADLEFTWTNPELGPMHGIDRCLIAGGKPYAIFFATPARHWATYEQHRQVMLESFRGGRQDTE